MNNIQLLGRFAADPMIKYTKNGCVAHFTLAVNRPYTKATEGQKADFIPCVAFDKVAETIGNTISKGQRIIISNGSLHINQYQDQQGNNRYHTEVHVHSYDYVEAKDSYLTTMAASYAED